MVMINITRGIIPHKEIQFCFRQINYHLNQVKDRTLYDSLQTSITQLSCKQTRHKSSSILHWILNYQHKNQKVSFLSLYHERNWIHSLSTSIKWLKRDQGTLQIHYLANGNKMRIQLKYWSTSQTIRICKISYIEPFRRVARTAFETNKIQHLTSWYN